jgi:hypothetical protein
MQSLNQLPMLPTLPAQDQPDHEDHSTVESELHDGGTMAAVQL